MKPIRHYENLHIPLWLLKDTCWMLEWKALGVAMIVPTLGVAIAIVVKTFRQKDAEVWINLAICFWIAANAYWMCCEFFGHVELKDYAGYPFLAGFICVSWFYGKIFFEKKRTTLKDYI
jgi:hypothetical protein